jgi:putative peptidoglycan lipid II flippase
MTPSGGAHVVRSAVGLGLCTALSRFLGFVREVLMAVCFGTTLTKSAFDVAFRLPNLLRSLFGEGALSAALVPVFTETLEKDGVPAVNRLVGRVAVLLAIVLGVLTAAGFVVVTLAMPAMDPAGKAAAVLPLLRLLLPYMLFICLVAMCAAVLNAMHRFVLPAMGPVVLNVMWIAALMVVALGFRGCPETGIRVVCWVIVGAGAVQLILLWVGLIRSGIEPRFAFDAGDARVLRILKLMGPAAVGAGVYQVNVMVSGLLALWAGAWAPAALTYAERLVYLPLGVIATAMGTVLLPTFSQQAVRGDHGAIRGTFAESLRSVMLVMTPAAVGLAVLAGPVVDLVFVWKGGKFQAESAVYTTRALFCYAPGLVAFSLAKLMVPAFYAMQDMRTPIRSGLWAMGANLVLNLVFIVTWPEGYQHAGLATATVLASLLNAGQLAVALQRRIGSPGWGAIGGAVARMALAAAAMGGVAWTVNHLLLDLPALADVSTKARQAIALGSAMAVGAGTYVVAVRVLCPADFACVRAGLRRRSRGNSRQAVEV